MKRLAFLVILICLVIGIIGTGCDTVPTEPPKEKLEPFSFALITDLHIGHGIPNYYPEYPTKEGFDWLDELEGSPGQNDKNADALKGVVEKIIEEKESFNIKFVVILGDVSDTAEKSEFLKAREILNRLNERGIPYIPLIGNHDTWPYRASPLCLSPAR